MFRGPDVPPFHTSQHEWLSSPSFFFWAFTQKAGSKARAGQWKLRRGISTRWLALPLAGHRAKQVNGRPAAWLCLVAGFLSKHRPQNRMLGADWRTGYTRRHDSTCTMLCCFAVFCERHRRGPKQRAGNAACALCSLSLQECWHKQKGDNLEILLLRLCYYCS